MVLRNENGLSSITKGRVTTLLWDMAMSLSPGNVQENRNTFSGRYVSILQSAWEARTQQRVVLQPCYILPLGLVLVSRRDATTPHRKDQSHSCGNTQSTQAA